MLLKESARITEDIVAGMEEKTNELYDALEKKTEELNSKNDLLEVNVAVMRNMTNTHQSRLKQIALSAAHSQAVQSANHFTQLIIPAASFPPSQTALAIAFAAAWRASRIGARTAEAASLQRIQQ